MPDDGGKMVSTDCDAENLLQQYQTDNAKLREFKERADELVLVRKRELDLIAAQLGNPEAPCGEDLPRAACLYERLAILEAMYRMKRRRDVGLDAVLKSFQASSSLPAGEVRRKDKIPQKRIVKKDQTLVRSARKRRLIEECALRRAKEVTKLGTDRKKELVRLKRRSIGLRREKKRDARRQLRKAQLAADFDALLRNQQSSSAPREDVDDGDNPSSENLAFSPQIVQATIRVVLADESDDTVAADLVDWLKVATSTIGIPSLEPLRLLELQDTYRQLKTSDSEGVVTLDIKCKVSDAENLDDVERALRVVCSMSAKDVSLTVDEKAESSSSEDGANEHAEKTLHTFGVILDDEESQVQATIEELIRGSTLLSRVKWLENVDILRKPRDMIVIRALLGPDDLAANAILEELSSLANFACIVTDTSHYVGMGNAKLSHHEILDDDCPHPLEQGKQSSEIKNDYDIVLDDCLQDPFGDATPPNNNVNDSEGILAEEKEEVSSNKFVASSQASTLVSKERASESSSRSLLSSDPDLRTIKFNIKFPPDVDPCAVAACVFSLENVKLNCDWDLEDVMYAANPEFPAIIVTANLFEGVDKEKIYDALNKELIENPKCLVATFLDYLYDWNQPRHATRLPKADIVRAMKQKEIDEDAEKEKLLAATAPASRSPSSTSSSFGSLQKELAFVGLSEYYGTLQSLGAIDLSTLAALSKADILGIAKKAGMSGEHESKLIHLAQDFSRMGSQRQRRFNVSDTPSSRSTTSGLRKRFEDAKEATQHLFEQEEASGKKSMEEGSDEVEVAIQSENDTNLAEDCLVVTARDGKANQQQEQQLEEPQLCASVPLECEVESSLPEGGEDDISVGDDSMMRQSSSLVQETITTLTHDNVVMTNDSVSGGSGGENRQLTQLDGKNSQVPQLNTQLRQLVRANSMHQQAAQSESRQADESVPSTQTVDEAKEDLASNSLPLLQDDQTIVTAPENEAIRTGLLERQSPGSFEKQAPAPSSSYLQEAVAEEESANILSIGSRVDVNYRGLGEIYSGSISQVNSDGTYTVNYDDGDIETAVPKASIHSSDAGSPYAMKNLSVGTRVECNFHGTDDYYPGFVSKVNADGTYAVDYDDGDHEEGVIATMIRPLFDFEDSSSVEDDNQNECQDSDGSAALHVKNVQDLNESQGLVSSKAHDSREQTLQSGNIGEEKFVRSIPPKIEMPPSCEQNSTETSDVKDTSNLVDDVTFDNEGHGNDRDWLPPFSDDEPASTIITREMRAGTEADESKGGGETEQRPLPGSKIECYPSTGGGSISDEGDGDAESTLSTG